ncbi:hypothetical protein ACVGWQ_13155, partial [Enterobacter hormaechei]
CWKIQRVCCWTSSFCSLGRGGGGWRGDKTTNAPFNQRLLVHKKNKKNNAKKQFFRYCLKPHVGY